MLRWGNLETEMRRRDERISQLETLLADKSRQVDEMAQTGQRIAAEMNKYQTLYAACQKQVAASAEEKARVLAIHDGKLSSMLQALAEQRGESTRLQDKVAVLEAALVDRTQDACELRAQLDTARATIRRLEATHREDVEAADQLREHLEKQGADLLSSSTSQLELAQQEWQRADTRARELGQELEAVGEQLRARDRLCTHLDRALKQSRRSEQVARARLALALTSERGGGGEEVGEGDDTEDSRWEEERMMLVSAAVVSSAAAAEEEEEKEGEGEEGNAGGTGKGQQAGGDEGSRAASHAIDWLHVADLAESRATTIQSRHQSQSQSRVPVVPAEGQQGEEKEEVRGSAAPGVGEAERQADSTGERQDHPQENGEDRPLLEALLGDDERGVVAGAGAVGGVRGEEAAEGPRPEETGQRERDDERVEEEEPETQHDAQHTQLVDEEDNREAEQAAGLAAALHSRQATVYRSMDYTPSGDAGDEQEGKEEKQAGGEMESESGEKAEKIEKTGGHSSQVTGSAEGNEEQQQRRVAADRQLAQAQEQYMRSELDLVRCRADLERLSARLAGQDRTVDRLRASLACAQRVRTAAVSEAARLLCQARRTRQQQQQQQQQAGAGREEKSRVQGQARDATGREKGTEQRDQASQTGEAGGLLSPSSSPSRTATQPNPAAAEAVAARDRLLREQQERILSLQLEIGTERVRWRHVQVRAVEAEAGADKWRRRAESERARYEQLKELWWAHKLRKSTSASSQSPPTVGSPGLAGQREAGDSDRREAARRAFAPHKGKSGRRRRQLWRERRAEREPIGRRTPVLHSRQAPSPTGRVPSRPATGRELDRAIVTPRPGGAPRSVSGSDTAARLDKFLASQPPAQDTDLQRQGQGQQRQQLQEQEQQSQRLPSGLDLSLSSRPVSDHGTSSNSSQLRRTGARQGGLEHGVSPSAAVLSAGTSTSREDGWQAEAEAGRRVSRRSAPLPLVGHSLDVSPVLRPLEQPSVTGSADSSGVYRWASPLQLSLA